MAKDIYYNLLKRRRPVVANFPIDMDYLTKNGRKKSAKFTYVDNKDLNVKWLYQYAVDNHILGKEGQTIVFIDECQILFNPREFSRADRLEWITFFTQHRKLGYHFILCSQFDRLVDRQIRCLFEYEVKHRKLNNFGAFIFLPVSTFVAISYWYSVKERIDRQIFVHRRKYSEIYNSFMMFDGAIKGVVGSTSNDADYADEESLEEIEDDGCTEWGDGVAEGTRSGWPPFKVIGKIFRRKKSA